MLNFRFIFVFVGVNFPFFCVGIFVRVFFSVWFCFCLFRFFFNQLLSVLALVRLFRVRACACFFFFSFFSFLYPLFFMFCTSPSPFFQLSRCLLFFRLLFIFYFASEMAKRASEKSFFGADSADGGGVSAEGDGDGAGGGGGSGSGGGGMLDGSASGLADGGGGGSGGEALVPRKSFVMKRGWGSMKMVEVSEGS